MGHIVGFPGSKVASGGGGFTPLSLPTLDWYLNADSISGSDGDPVVDWLDSSPSGKHYGQNTVARQPTLKVNLYTSGTRNAVRFGTNKCLVPDPNAYVYGPANTLWCVCTPSSAADYILRGNQAQGGPAFISKFNNGGVRDFEYFYTSPGERGVFATSASGLHALLLLRTDDTGNYVGYFDGVQVFSTAVNTGNDWNVVQASIIGAFTAGSSAYDGDIVEIGHCNTVLSGTDLTNLNNYLVSLL